MLDLVNDSQAHNALLDQSRAISLAIHNMYLAPGGPKRVELPHDVREDSLANLRALCHLQGTFDTVSKQALDQLYRQHFSTFIRTKIAEHAKVRLSAFTSREERGDIGEVFCLTNPRLPDHPIVLVSDGFCRLTGYPRDQIVGRNCRFLQGPSSEHFLFLVACMPSTDTLFPPCRLISCPRVDPEAARLTQRWRSLCRIAPELVSRIACPCCLRKGRR